MNKKTDACRERAVTEVIGAVMLISVVVVAVGIIGVTLTSQGSPQKIPALDAVISNIGRNVSIYHDGGDTLSNTEMYILVNEARQDFSKNNDPGWTTWSVGESLNNQIPGTDPISSVMVVYDNAGSSAVLSAANFGISGMPTNIPTTIPITTHIITASAGTGGSISPSGSVPVYDGSSKTFTITHSPGYEITDVIVDGVSQGPVSSYLFMNVWEAHTISAMFTINTYTITPSVSGGNGAVDPATAQTVDYGAMPTFTFTPATGYHLDTVTVDSNPVTPSGNSYTFPAVTANHTIVGTFAINTYTITASSGGDGAVTPAGVTTWNYGDTPTYIISPNPGYHIVDVEVNGISMGPATSYIFPGVTSNQTISATFAINTYAITADPKANGAITPAGTTIYNYGATPTYTITPNSGYHIVDVEVDGISVGAVTSYLFPSLTKDMPISATFAINTYTINASAGANGAVNPAGVTTVNYGDTPTYTITPNTGYHVVDVLVNGTSVGAVTSYVFPSVTTDKTISATFAINTYTITASSGANGAISPAGVTTVSYGGSQAFTITPAIKYHTQTLVVDGDTTTYPPKIASPYTFSNVQGNHAIDVTFAQNPRQQIYYENFNSAGWPYTGWYRSSNNVVTSTTYRNGTSGNSIRIRRSDYMNRTISTAGYSDIVVQFAWLGNPIASGHHAEAQYTTDGTTWTSFQQLTGPLTQTTLTIVTDSSLPATIEDNTNFGLRWRQYSGTTGNEYIYVDDVMVTGIPDYI